MRNDGIQYSLGVSQVDVTDGVGGDAPFRATSVQGRVTFHLSPTLRPPARLYGDASFSKVRGEPGITASPSGLGIVNAVPLAAGLASLYNHGAPVSQLNSGNATF